LAKSQKPFDRPEKPFDICKISLAENEISFAKDETSFAERKRPFAKPEKPLDKCQKPFGKLSLATAFPGYKCARFTLIPALRSNRYQLRLGGAQATSQGPIEEPFVGPRAGSEPAFLANHVWKRKAKFSMVADWFPSALERQIFFSRGARSRKPKYESYRIVWL
jgi:hypothetical protein